MQDQQHVVNGGPASLTTAIVEAATCHHRVVTTKRQTPRKTDQSASLTLIGVAIPVDSRAISTRQQFTAYWRQISPEDLHSVLTRTRVSVEVP